MRGIWLSYTCLGLQLLQSPGSSAALAPGEVELSAVTVSGRPIHHLPQQLKSSPAPRPAFLSKAPGTGPRTGLTSQLGVLLSSFLSSASVLP